MCKDRTEVAETALDASAVVSDARALMLLSEMFAALRARVTTCDGRCADLEAEICRVSRLVSLQDDLIRKMDVVLMKLVDLHSSPGELSASDVDLMLAHNRGVLAEREANAAAADYWDACDALPSG